MLGAAVLLGAWATALGVAFPGVAWAAPDRAAGRSAAVGGLHLEVPQRPSRPALEMGPGAPGVGMGDADRAAASAPVGRGPGKGRPEAGLPPPSWAPGQQKKAVRAASGPPGPEPSLQSPPRPPRRSLNASLGLGPPTYYTLVVSPLGAAPARASAGGSSSNGSSSSQPSGQSPAQVAPRGLVEQLQLSAGAWPGLSVKAATSLEVPIAFGVAVAAFVVLQSMLGRRDPKLVSAPESPEEDTVAFG
jgi:hypothetical protein